MPRNARADARDRRRSALPGGDGWAFELKWDGVRALAFVAGGAAADLRPARRGRHPALPGAGGDRRGARRPRADPRRRGGRLRRGRATRASASCSGAWGSPTEARIRQRAGRDPGHLRRLRPALARRPLAARRALRAPPRAARRARLRRARLAGAAPPPRRRRGAAAGRCASAGSRGSSPSGSRSPYRPGRRSADWVKVQNRRRQELVIGGWMPGEGGRGARGSARCWSATGTRRPAEAARLGRPQRLVYAGGVGTGFTAGDARASSTDLLEPLRRETSPFEAGWDPRVKYAARVRERGALRLGRAGGRLRGRVPALDPRGHPARRLVQGPPRRQGPARGRARVAERKIAFARPRPAGFAGNLGY